jgi:hypothetical protein
MVMEVEIKPNTKMAVFWEAVQCSLLDIDPDDGGSKNLYNVRQYLPEFRMQHPRR